MIKIELYAQALFEVVKDPLIIYEEIKTFQQLLRDEEVLNVFKHTYADPTILTPLWDALNMSSESIKTFALLQNDLRIIDFDRFVESFQELLVVHHYIARAEVKVAHMLNDVEIERLKTMLSKKYQGIIEMHLEEDPSLIKGMVVKINNDVIDTSLKNKLEQIKLQGGR